MAQHRPALAFREHMDNEVQTVSTKLIYDELVCNGIDPLETVSVESDTYYLPGCVCEKLYYQCANNPQALYPELEDKSTEVQLSFLQL